MTTELTIATAVTAGAVLAGLLIGWGLHHNLGTLAYRRDTEQHLPAPPHQWTIPLYTAVGAGLLAFRANQTGNWQPALLALPVLVLGIWLAAVDADVQRLPFRQVAALGLLETVALVGITIATRSPLTAILGAAGGLLSYGAFRLFHHATHGALGYGDVTLAAPLGAAATAAGGPILTWWWVFLSFAAAGIYALTTRRKDDRALGPWLVFGAVLALSMGNP